MTWRRWLACLPYLDRFYGGEPNQPFGEQVRHASETGCTRMESTADRDNLLATGFHERLGFAEHDGEVLNRVAGDAPWARRYRICRCRTRMPGCGLVLEVGQVRSGVHGEAWSV